MFNEFFILTILLVIVLAVFDVFTSVIDANIVLTLVSLLQNVIKFIVIY